MSELDDHDLLAQYARESSEGAFSALVSRYLNLVHSVALRKTGDAGAAEEIAQAVFIILAKKAGGLSRRVVLSGWLYHTTRLTAANYVRSEIRRQKREQEACMQIDDAETWRSIAPVLEDAMAKLRAKDRDAVVLRFFENKSLREVGLAMGASEDAAKMRVNRALARLRKIFGKRGLTLSGAAIAGAVSAHSVQAAPVVLAQTISTVAAGQGAAAGGATLALVKGALKFMAWTKMQTAVVTTAVVLLVAGTTAVTVRESGAWGVSDRWWEDIANLDLSKAPETTVLRRTHFPTSRNVPNGVSVVDGMSAMNGKLIGKDYDFKRLIAAAYDFDGQKFGWVCMLFPQSAPKGYYDFMATVSDRPAERLQSEIRRKLGFIARPQLIETNAFILTLKNPALTVSNVVPRTATLALWNQSRDFSAWVKEWQNILEVPITDQTGLTNHYDFRSVWPPGSSMYGNNENLKKTLLDRLGLELVPTNMPVEMLVVERVGS